MLESETHNFAVNFNTFNNEEIISDWINLTNSKFSAN